MAINKIVNGMKGLNVRTILNQVIDEVNSLATLTPEPKFKLDAQTIAGAMDNGIASGAGSLKTLGQGWHVIPASNAQMTGRPSGSTGDLIYFTQDVGGGTGYSYGFAIGKDKQGVDTMWVQYRDGSKWSSWWPVQNLKQLVPTGDVPTEIAQEIANLKQGQINAIERIQLLETRLGGIFAPNRASFDRAVQGLIQPELTKIEEKIQDNTQSIQALGATALTLDQVSTHLKALGWGPLPTDQPRPVPDGDVEYFAAYSNVFPTTMGALKPASEVTTLTRSGSGGSRIFVLVKNDAGQGGRVTGISIDGGIAARWQHRDVTINAQKFMAFYSPSAYYEQTNTVKVNYN